MKTFIKKQQYNYIKECLYNLNNNFRNCTDANIMEITKSYIQDKIFDAFTDLSEKEREILDIIKITDPLQINGYLTNLNQYVYGMSNITNSQIQKIFKKEKKLKLPNFDILNSKPVYLGWIDESLRKLFIIHNINGNFVGMACKLPKSNSNNSNICALCNHVGNEHEIAFVSCICKTSNPGLDSYKSIAFYACLDSTKCNERIVSTEKLESLLKDVNNIK